MIQDGTAGLVKAVERFDPEKVRRYLYTILMICPWFSEPKQKFKWWAGLPRIICSG